MNPFQSCIATADAVVLATFGETVSYQAQGQLPATVKVVWTEGSSVPDGIEAEAWAPAGTFDNPQKGDLFTRSNRLYVVAVDPLNRKQPGNGTDIVGGIRLLLRLVQQNPS